MTLLRHHFNDDKNVKCIIWHHSWMWLFILFRSWHLLVQSLVSSEDSWSTLTLSIHHSWSQVKAQSSHKSTTLHLNGWVTYGNPILTPWHPFYEHKLPALTAWIRNHIHFYMWGLMIHTRHNYRVGLSSPPLTFWIWRGNCIPYLGVSNYLSTPLSQCWCSKSQACFANDLVDSMLLYHQHWLAFT